MGRMRLFQSARAASHPQFTQIANSYRTPQTRTHARGRTEPAQCTGCRIAKAVSGGLSARKRVERPPSSARQKRWWAMYDSRCC